MILQTECDKVVILGNHCDEESKNLRKGRAELERRDGFASDARFTHLKRPDTASVCLKPSRDENTRQACLDMSYIEELLQLKNPGFDKALCLCPGERQQAHCFDCD